MGKLKIPISEKNCQKYTSSLSKQIKIKLNEKGLIWSHEWWFLFPFHPVSFGNDNLTVESTGFAFDFSALMCGLNVIVKCGWYREKSLLNRPFSDNRSLLSEFHNSWYGYSWTNKKFSKIIFLLFTYHSHCPNFSRSLVDHNYTGVLPHERRVWEILIPLSTNKRGTIALEKGEKLPTSANLGNLWK